MFGLLLVAGPPIVSATDRGNREWLSRLGGGEDLGAHGASVVLVRHRGNEVFAERNQARMDPVFNFSVLMYSHDTFGLGHLTRELPRAIDKAEGYLEALRTMSLATARGGAASPDVNPAPMRHRPTLQRVIFDTTGVEL